MLGAEFPWGDDIVLVSVSRLKTSLSGGHPLDLGHGSGFVRIHGRKTFAFLFLSSCLTGLVAAFALTRDQTQDPLTRQIYAYVMEDEARHVAFGRLSLDNYYSQLTERERAEREEFVIEASYLLRDRFRAETVWEAVFPTIMMGDDRATASVYIAGQRFDPASGERES